MTCETQPELTSLVLPLKSTWRRVLISAWTACDRADLGLQLELHHTFTGGGKQQQLLGA